MISFFFTTWRLIRAFALGCKEKEFQSLLFLTVVLLLSGTVFYTRVENWRAIDSFYFSAITLTTIGYGDITPQTDLGKIFTIMYIFLGLGLVFGFVSKVADYTGLRKK